MITGIVLGETSSPGTVVKRVRKSSVTTLTTKTTHHINVGGKVVISGLGDKMDGTFTVSAVSAKNKFSYRQKYSDVTEKKSSGTYQRATGSVADISEIITSLSVSLSVGAVSQVTINVSDPGLLYMKANYFQLRQKVRVAGEMFEIAALEVSQGSAGEELTLECRLTGVQKLKRDKGKAVYSGGSATSYIAERARSAGLGFFGETSSAKSQISRVRNDKVDESSWKVMERLAGDNQFMMFETGGRIFFCSQQFLLGKYSLAPDKTRPGFLTTIVRWDSSYDIKYDADQSSYITKRNKEPIVGPSGRPLLIKGSTGKHVEYVQKVLKARFGPSDLPTDGKFSTSTFNAVLALQKFYTLAEKGKIGKQTWAYIDMLASGKSTTSTEDEGFFASYAIIPLSVPTLRTSDDSAQEVTATFSVKKEIGVLLRPGMTISMRGVPGFTVDMLINEVSWQEGTPDPVSVSASTPSIPDDAKKAITAAAKIDLTGGGFGNVAASSF